MEQRAPSHPSRSRRWSPTRSAFAMMVSAGFTAQLEGEEARVDDVEVVDVVGLQWTSRVEVFGKESVCSAIFSSVEPGAMRGAPARSVLASVFPIIEMFDSPLLCRRRAGGPDVRTVLMRTVAAGLRAGSSGTRPDVKRPVSLRP